MANNPTHQRILRNTFTAAILSVFFMTCIGSAEPVPKSHSDVVIYEGQYPGWPWITKAADGILYCVLREGTIHGYSPSGRVVLTKSTDNGLTWTTLEIPNTEGFVGDEWDVIEVEPDRLVGIHRNRRLIVDYEIRDQSKRIAGYFVEFPENWGETPARPTKE